MLVAIEVLAANKISGIKDSDELIEKYRKLLKIGKLSKSQELSKTRKLFKSQKLAKLRKELSKNENLPNFNIKENKPSFLTPNTRMAFNHL